MNKAEEVFKDEIGMIADEYIKRFVISVFEQVPAYFWSAPCSTTGKYHPRWSQGEGGIVRHTKLTAFYASELTRAMPLTKEEVMRTGCGEQLYRDIVVAAALLHDGWKHGANFTGELSSIPENNTECHGVWWATHIFDMIVTPKLKEAKKEMPFKLKAVLRGIAGHMGIWTGGSNLAYWPTYQKDTVLRKVCEIVHLADFISSRKPTDALYAILEQKG